MATTKIILLGIKRHKDGRHPVVLRFTQHRKRHYLATGIACHEDEWDPLKEQLRTVVVDHKKKNVLIRAWREQARMILNELSGDDGYLTFEKFRHEFRRALFRHATVSKYFYETVQQFKENGQLSNAAIYRNTNKYLMRFNNGQEILFQDLDKPFLENFSRFLEEQVNSRGGRISAYTRQVYLRTIRALYNKAIEEGIVDKMGYPFANRSNPDGFKIPKPHRRVKKAALTKEQVAQIIQYNAIPGTSFYHTKNYFVFSYLAGGMDFNDLALLTWRSVNGDRMEYKRVRSGKKYSIRVNKEMKRIMDHYWSHNAKYVFPILDEKNDRPADRIKRIRAARKLFNENITEIAGSLGINMKITSSMIRHTYASILYRQGAPLPEISMALKHNNVLETMAYLGDIELGVRDGLQDMLL